MNPVHLDPALWLGIPQSSRAWLLDCGDLSRLSLSELHAVDTVFLSHGHIDHWIGLDQLLRSQLFQSSQLRILGPSGLHRMLAGRLQGYAWNLVAESAFSVSGYELRGQQWWRVDYPCCQRFEPEHPPQPDVLPELEGWQLDWIELEHGVPCLGYRLQSPRQFRFDPTAAAARGLAPGPWVEQLKQNRIAEASERPLLIAETWHPGGSLWELLEEVPSISLAYITDTRLDPATRRRIVESFGATQQLWCEAAFVETQRELAESKLHATAREAAQLALELPANELRLFHLSRRTQGLADEHLREARAIFPNSQV